MAIIAKRIGTSGANFTELPNMEYVSQKSDLPSPSAGVITLLADTTYFFIGTIDLTGDRLVGDSNTCLLGNSSENAFLTSTGLGAGVALFTTDYTTPIRHISFKDVDTAIDIDGSRSGQNPALDWYGVNFVNVPNVGTIKDVDNWIYSTGAVLNSRGLKFDGSIGTVGASNSIFVGDGSAGNIVEILSTANITRRFRIIYSSVVAFASTTGIDVDVSATIPVEGYILDTINFSGGSTYLAGVDYLDNKSSFVRCIGINNTTEIGNYYMTGNSTATTISVASTPVKVAGITTANAINQKFSHIDNRLTFTGALANTFEVNSIATFITSNNRDIKLSIAKNGTVIADSSVPVTSDNAGKAHAVPMQTILEMQTNDYIEIFVQNDTDTNSITVEYLSTTIKVLEF
tara:strand:+ start:12759 stop:13964 length:1206 start_codon:yes stop_codon:yes gene_type:complete